MKVVLGTYVAGNSILHRADVRVKILIALMIGITLFFITSAPVLAFVVALTVIAYFIAKIPFKTALKVMQPVFVIVAFTLLVQTFSLDGHFGYNPAGFFRGLFFVARILCVMGATGLLTLTTSVVDLSDALASLMRPLSRLKVPVEDIALMMSIGLRFIPTIAEELDRILLTQKMRGARFDEGSLYVRLIAWVPVFIPLFVGMFRRADSLALAMEARGYTGEARTRLNQRDMKRKELIAVIACLLLCIALIVVSRVL